MSTIKVQPALTASTATTITIELDPETLAVQADIVASLAATVGARTIDIDGRGVGGAISDHIYHNDIEHRFMVINHYKGFPA